MNASEKNTAPLVDNAALLNVVRAILLSQDRQQLEALEDELRDLTLNTATSQRELTERVNTIFAQLTDLDTKTRVNADVQRLAERLTPMMTGLIRHTIQDSPDEMAEAIGPVMGEAIRVQIRDSRKEMVEAIYPIIGETIQRAISEFAKELQRNIDARLKSPLTPKGFAKRFRARLRGISDAELTLREALPFQVSELFLIQHNSGLLLAHHQPEGGEGHDSDLISAMLTAIRDFVQDTFENRSDTQDRELGEIGFGNQQITIESGKHAYLAAVYSGVETEGFRAALREFVSDLHVQHSPSLRAYTGDPTTLPDFSSALMGLAFSPVSKTAQTTPLRRGQKIGLAGAGIAVVLLTTLACFYLWFTIALWPAAFPKATMTPTASLTATATASPTANPTATPTPTPAPSATPTFTPTATLPIPSPTLAAAITTGNLNLRAVPQSDAQVLGVVPVNTSVQILSIYGEWVQISWKNAGLNQDGWISARWVQLPEGVPASMITPTTAETP